MTSTDKLREFIIEQIRDQYDRAPDDYKPGDTWDDGTGRIADAIISGPLAELMWERDVLRMANAKIPEAFSGAFRTGAEAMREECAAWLESNGQPGYAVEIRCRPLPTTPKGERTHNVMEDSDEEECR